MQAKRPSLFSFWLVHFLVGLAACRASGSIGARWGRIARTGWATKKGVYYFRHGLLAVIWLVYEVGVVFEGRASGKIWKFLNRRLLGPRRGKN